MSRTLDRILRHFDDLSPFPLLSSSFLRERGMHRRERIEHCFVQGSMVGVDRRGVLAQVVQTREGFTAMTWEGSFTGMFPAWSATRLISYSYAARRPDSPDMPGEMLGTSEDFVALAVPSAPEHFAATDTNGDDRRAVRGEGEDLLARPAIAGRGR